ncbi:MAG TPA: hypothetical protein PLA88_07920 [Bacteroidales bacterium]|nr:hypothetical protein [Bacteroidales bacterium]
MMKTVTLLVLLAASAIAGYAQDTVFTVRVYEKKQMVERRSYGIHGNMMAKETRLSEEPLLWFREFMIYDKGKLIRSGHYIDDTDVTDYSYEYNEKGKLEKKRETKQGVVSGETFYQYNEKGWLTEEESYVGKRKKIVTDYDYTLEGLVKKRTENISDSNRIMVLSELYFYNIDGKIIRMVGMNGDDTISDIRYTYDQFGFKLRQDVISHSDTTLSVVWLYGRNGSHPMIEKHMADGYVVRKTKNFFNKEGRIKKEIIMEYRVYSGKMKPEKTIRKYRYFWND